jgi:hypothetical protein
MQYRIPEAYSFYKEFIYNERRQELLRQHNLSVTGSVPSIDWELFGAIITGDGGKVGYGSDLEHHEVKSSVDKSSFEYQYHLNGGMKKLTDDTKVDHVFISYSPDYKNVEVRVVKGSALRDSFKSWIPGLKANYEGKNPKQRFRRSIPYGTVKNKGKLIMKIEQGEVVKLSTD